MGNHEYRGNTQAVLDYTNVSILLRQVKLMEQSCSNASTVFVKEIWVF